MVTVLVMITEAAGFYWGSSSYRQSIGEQNYVEKQKGTDLIRKAVQEQNNVFILGSSELMTTMIASHPARMFNGQQAGFQVNLIGRGSCQSIIHALVLGANGNELKDSKIILITSPQSFVHDGIAPDMFMANFSEQQFLDILLDEQIESSIKKRLANRTSKLFELYKQENGVLVGCEAAQFAASLWSQDNREPTWSWNLFKPYFYLQEYLLNLKDKEQSARLIASITEDLVPENFNIDWQKASELMLQAGITESNNNQYGILNDYYSTYIGKRLDNMEGKDDGLSLAESVEYEDLRLLLDICRQFELEVMFVHVPMHGAWYDYVGLDKSERDEYYQHVREIVTQYDVKLLDLTGYEYEQYFLCDIMHLGWMGWLKTNEEIYRFYHENQ